MVIIPEKYHKWPVMVLLISCLLACANYPADPKTTNANADEYTIAEDGYLSVSSEEGILINDTPGEGTEISLVTLDELETVEGGLVVLIEDGSFTYEPKADFYGTDQVNYTVENDKGQTATGTIYFNVTPINDAPVLSAISDQTAPENTAVNINFEITDPDTDPQDLTIDVHSDNTILVPDEAVSIAGNGKDYILSIMPPQEQYGVATIRITVSDGNPPDILTDQAEFLLTVTQTNSPPTIEPIEDQATTWSTSISIPITIGDDETPTDQLVLTGLSSDQQLVSDENIVFYGVDADRAVTITPNRYAVGYLSIQIAVTDSGDDAGNDPLTAVQSFDMIIESPFGPRTQSGQAFGKSISIQPLNASDHDPSGEPFLMTPTGILMAFYRGDISVNEEGCLTYSPQKESTTENVGLNQNGGCATTNDFRIALSSETCELPEVQPDRYVVQSTQVLEMSSADGLLANDHDPSGLGLSIAEPGFFDTLYGGTVQLRPDGGFSYEPPNRFQGADGFTYSATNGLNSVIGIAVIKISP